jgi:ribosome-binding protein aMBF1 (putative translation factor)
MNEEKEFVKYVEEFTKELSVNQKAWGIVNDFYHFLLTEMEKQKISKEELSKKLGKQKSKIFDKTTKMNIYEMVEIADSVGLNIKISRRKN